MSVVDPVRWTDVANPPHAPVRARIARALLSRAACLAGIRVELPEEPAFGGPPRSPAIRIENPGEFFSRVGADGLIGLGEGWMSGAWTSTDLHGVLHALACRIDDAVPRPLHRLRPLVRRPMPAEEDADHAGARRNASRHYDLSNELFEQFLDPTMSYSAALFGDGDDLERAQVRKTDAILDAARVGENTNVLEIGTGWGFLAVRAAQRGARVTSITLSTEQQDAARKRAAECGVSDLVEVRLCDFRDVAGTYDAVVSVEMIEAVGERYWPDYFRALGSLLAPGGRIALQAITMSHEHLLATRGSWGWIHKYVFPGGLIPSLPAIRTHAERDGGLQLLEHRSFGPHYAETLRLWSQRFAAAERAVDALGFDEVFRRMWEYYLAYSRAGFSSGHLDVQHVVLGAGDVR